MKSRTLKAASSLLFSGLLIAPTITTLAPSSAAYADDGVVSTANADIEEHVKAIIADQLQIELADISNEASFVEDLGADSIALVELTMALEESFVLEIPDDEAVKLTTVQDVINYITNQLSGSY